ncbi:MAG: DUF4383 domain-containing protein [Solirubrobacterales bacterium]
MDRSSFTRLHASVAGLVLSLLGLIGFAVGSEFAEPTLTVDLLGFYPVNGWADTLHLATGLAALLLARARPGAWALVGGLLYTGLGIWGVLAPDGQLLAGLLPASRSVNLLNLLIGLTGLVAFAAARLPGVKTSGAGRRRRIRRARRRRRKVSRPETGSGTSTPKVRSSTGGPDRSA